MRLVSISLFLVSSFLAFPATGQTIIRVDDNGTKKASEACGADWANACLSLQAGLTRAGVGPAEIWIAAGVYYPDVNAEGVDGDSPTTKFTLASGFELYGGFAGGELTRDARDPETNVTILSGDITQNDTNADGNFIAESVSDIQGPNSSGSVVFATDRTGLVIDGVVITAGDAINANGGGLSLVRSAAVVSNATLSGNRTANSGGAIALNGSGNPFNLTLSDVVLRGNQATSNGGGLVTLFSGNTSQLAVSSSRFESNTALNGGGLYMQNVTVDISSSHFVGNVASAQGGGLNLAGGVGNVVNSLVSGNKANIGGGVSQHGSSVNHVNLTIAGNTCTAASCGAGFYRSDTAVFTIKNTVIWGNSPHNISRGTGSLNATVSHSLIEGYVDQSVFLDGGNNLTTDPLFVSPEDPANAPTLNGDYRIQLASPAVNVGDNTALPLDTYDLDGDLITGEQLPLDLAGFMRLQGGTVDMGAYERLLAVDYGDADGDGYLTTTGDIAGHVIGGPYLGTVSPDDELDGQRVAGTANGDDADGTDDEDGVSFPAPVYAFDGGAYTASIEVTTFGAGYLSVWIDLDRDGSFTDEATATGEEVLSDEPVGVSSTSVTTTHSFNVPASAVTGETFVRVRFCSTQDECDSPGGVAGDGEVEDYQISLLDGDNIEVGAGAGLDIDGSNIVLALGDGTTVTIPTSILTGGSLTLTGTDGPDSVTLTPEVMNAAGLTLAVHLGSGFDSLYLPQGTAIGDVTHTFTSATSGSVSVAGGATVTYTGLDPIVDNLDTANRIFTFSAATETIELSPDGDGVSGNGYSFIDSDVAEQVVFKNPTSSLTIDTGNGANTVVLGALDTPVAGVFTGITVTGGTGVDVFTVTPVTTYAITVHGAAPLGSCLGDGLVLDLTGGAVVDTYGAGTITFSSGHLSVSHTGIESVGDADLEVSANYDVLYATQDLTVASDNELVVTVTNRGENDADCVTLALDAALASWLDGAATAVSTGSFADPTWTVGTVAAGASETLTIRGFVTPDSPQSVAFSSIAVQDTNGENDTATVVLSMGFTMPVKAHVNAAHYFGRTVTTGTHDALLVGLYQGSPGIEGAVWCKIPTATAGTAWPGTIPAAAVGNHFRPCSGGLPFPLHVNDIYEDATGTLWLATWGSQGLYKSEDDGQTWEGTPPQGPGNNIVYGIVEDSGGGILYASANNGLVLRSFNDGATWQQVASLPGVASDTPWSLAAHPDPAEAGTIYAGTHGGGVYVTEDFGFTWSVLQDGSDENQDLLDGKAGHVFALEFSPDADYLYAATGSGVWQANLTGGPTTFAGTWSLIGPAVTLDDASTVTPQVRTLAFTDLGSGGAEDLIVGTWGFGAFVWEDPNATSIHGQLSLRRGEVLFMAGSSDGEVLVGTKDGSMTTISSSGATTTAKEPVATSLPDGYMLSQNYPNPFNPLTQISYALPEAGRVRLAVFDALGREVALLVDGVVEAGQHNVRFDAGTLPTGPYLYRLETVAGAMARTLVVLR